MSPRTFFARAMIIDAALLCVAESGFEHLTVRRVAEQLKSSTTPIFKEFPTMTALHHAVAKAILEDLKSWATREWPHTFTLTVAEGKFLNLGIGVASYAAENPRLFLVLLAPADATGGIGKAMRTFCLSAMKSDRPVARLPPAEQTALYERLLRYVMGLAFQLSMKNAQRMKPEVIAEDIFEVGTALLFRALSKGGK